MKVLIALSALLLLASASTLKSSITTIKDLFPKGRIVGGSVANSGAFPYTVYLSASGANGGWSCGGSILSNEWIITAAHCTYGASAIRIYAGTTTLNPLQAGAQIRDASQVIVHQYYNPQTLNNDISLIRLSQPLQLNNNVWPIRLITKPEGQYNWTGQQCVASGWGKTADNASGSNRLLYAYLNIENQNTCKNYYIAGLVNDGVICVNTQGGTKTTCQGDSGGPLATYNLPNSPVLVGITSFVATSGCQSGIPSGFVRVSYYRDWIKNYTGL